MVTLSDGISYSRLMRKELPYRILLPSGYGATDRRFPVLYLLHGLFGDCTNWTELTDLINYAADLSLVIVMPQGEDSWYVDSPIIADQQFESYFITEFMPDMESQYRIGNTDTGRAIAGLSMGGYGALKFAFKYHWLFAFAGSVSGAFSAPHQSDENPGFDWPTMKDSIIRAFGENDNRMRSENDLFKLIGSRLVSRQYPAICLDCGFSDGFRPVNQALHDLLQSHQIEHEFVITAGNHDWEYWNRWISRILPKINAILNF